MKRSCLAALVRAALAVASPCRPAQPTPRASASPRSCVGSIQDLSGPIAGFGKQVRARHAAARRRDQRAGRHPWPQAEAPRRGFGLRPEEGGPRRAEAGQPGQDLHMVGHIGTAHNNAAMPVQFEKNVINFLPITAAREMYEPFHRLKYSFAATYFDQIRDGAAQARQGQGREEGLHDLPGRRVRPRGVARRRGRPEDDGHGVRRKTSYKRGATDFSSQVARMKAVGCDIVLLGTIIRETIGDDRRGAQDRLRTDLPGHQRGLHRPDPQARRQGDGRALRDA